MANNSEEIFFAEEELSIETEKESWKILIVDDEKGVHSAIKIAIELLCISLGMLNRRV